MANKSTSFTTRYTHTIAPQLRY